MGGIDCTTLPSIGFDRSSTISGYYEIGYCEEELIEEEKEEVRSGWFNPQKLHILKKYIHKPTRIRIRIRNQL